MTMDSQIALPLRCEYGIAYSFCECNHLSMPLLQRPINQFIIYVQTSYDFEIRVLMRNYIHQ